MLRDQQYVVTRTAMAADLLLSAGAVVSAWWLRNAAVAPLFLPSLMQRELAFAETLWLLFVFPPAAVAVLALFGAYRVQWTRARLEWPVVILAAVVGAATAGALGLVLPPSLRGGEGHWPLRPLQQGVVIALPPVWALFILLRAALHPRLTDLFARRPLSQRSLILVGSGTPLRSLIRSIADHPEWALRIRGIVDDGTREGKEVDGIPVLGALPNLITLLESRPVDEVVFVPDRRPLADYAPILEQCEIMGLRTRLALNLFRHQIARPVLETVDGVPVVTYSPAREMGGALLVKHALDRIGALAFLVLLSPVMLVTALLIKATSQKWSDPIFFGQERVGLNGRRFTLWKFRSMVVDAEALREELSAQNEMEGPVFKIKRDPRVTAVGRWIRRLSVDELPQFWNVLRGEMSLVGPRPPLASEVEKYDRWQRRRLSMKPGLTCLWQVSGRNELSFETWMRLDLEYIDNWSLSLDFRILLRTVYVVLTGYGAM